METFSIYKPIAKGKPKIDKIENSRAIKVFSSTKKAKALEEDYKHGRMGEVM